MNFSNLRLEQLEADLPEHRPRAANSPVALEGIRVIDFTHFLAGPFATLMLADMGADVIKIESPGRGDEYRHYPPIHPDMPGQGSLFVWGNRNKRSIVLNLKLEAGMAVALDLIRDADVVVENFSPGVMKRLGLDYETLRKLNPGLIYCSVSGYGQEGEFSQHTLLDTVAQAQSGMMSMSGYPDRPGVRTASPMVDIATAMMASNGILGALVSRGRTGLGQSVDVALFDTAVLLTGPVAMQQLFSGDNPERIGNESHDSCPTGVFLTQDKPFSMICSNDATALRLLGDVLGRHDLAKDASLATRAGRMKRRDELLAVVRQAVERQPWSYWQPKMIQARIPCAEVRDLGDALRSEESRARNLVTRLSHATAGWIPNIALPIRYSGTPLSDPTVAPAIGEHTFEVLSNVLGYGAAHIEELRIAGVLDGA